MLGGFQGVNDGASIVAFEPAVSGDGSFTGAMGAGVHHDGVVAGAEEEFRLANDADAIVCDAMKEQDPTSVGMSATDFPAAQTHAVGSDNGEVFAVGTDEAKRCVSFPDEVGSQLPANRVEECGS
ncbi:MAG: hypothetical protein NVS9B13_03150 [Candidatus Acidiferrum sp.]